MAKRTKMSRIMDDIARADRQRRQNGVHGPEADRKGAVMGWDETVQGGTDWRETTGISSWITAAANRERLARQRRRRWSYGAGLVIAVVAGILIDRYLVEQILPVSPRQIQAPKLAASLPAPPPPAGALAVPQQMRLPAGIPLDAEDAGYASSHPGWRRYLSEAVEFRVCADPHSLKAIQIMARQEGALDGAVLDAFLGQVAGKASYKVTAREQRGGYAIEKGRLGSLAEVVTYRKLPSSEVRALVIIYLPS